MDQSFKYLKTVITFQMLEYHFMLFLIYHNFKFPIILGSLHWIWSYLPMFFFLLTWSDCSYYWTSILDWIIKDKNYVKKKLLHITGTLKEEVPKSGTLRVRGKWNWKVGALLALAALFWLGKLEKLYGFHGGPECFSTTNLWFTDSWDERFSDPFLVPGLLGSCEPWLTAGLAVAWVDLTSPITFLLIRPAWALMGHQMWSVSKQREGFSSAKLNRSKCGALSRLK